MQNEELNFEAESKALTIDWVDAINDVIDNFKDIYDYKNIINRDYDIQLTKD